MFIALIDWTDPSSSPWQWVNLVSGLLGLALTCVAAILANNARTAAQEARKSVSMLARHDRFQELQLEFQELYQLIGNIPLPMVSELLAAKCSRLVTAVIRFKTDAGMELSAENREKLDMIREQLREMGNTVFNSRIVEATRRMRFQVTLDAIAEAIGFIAANLGRALSENNNDN